MDARNIPNFGFLLAFFIYARIKISTLLASEEEKGEGVRIVYTQLIKV